MELSSGVNERETSIFVSNGLKIIYVGPIVRTSLAIKIITSPDRDKNLKVERVQECSGEGLEGLFESNGV